MKDNYKNNTLKLQEIIIQLNQQSLLSKVALNQIVSTFDRKHFSKNWR